MMQFFLNFKSFETPKQIEITEAVKSDAFASTIEQDKQLLGRDVTFGAEEVSLFFYKGVYDTSANPLQLANGVIVYNLTMGFDELKKAWKQKGFESDIEFIISVDGETFTTGALMIINTDEVTFFEAKIIQETDRAEIKRRAETKVDVFSDKDLKGNSIQPLETVNLLLKAKPTEFVSEWTVQEGATVFAAGSLSSPPFFNKIKNTTGIANIPNTLSWLTDYTQNGNTGDYDDYNPPPDYFRIIKARFLLTGLKATLDLSFTNEWIAEGLSGNFNIVGRFIKFSEFEGVNNFIDIFNDDTSPDNIQFYISPGLGPSSGNYVYNFDGTITVDLPDMQPGQVLAFVFYHRGSNNTQVSKNVFNSAKLSIKATENGFDSVIKVVRYGGLFRQNIKAINEKPVLMPRFDVGGEFHNLFATNGYLIRQFTDRAFRVTWKQITEGGLPAFYGGRQVTPNEVFIGRYPDFFPNREIAVFIQAPDASFNIGYSDKSQINTVDAQFKTYEKERDSEGTMESIHNIIQYSLPNEMVNNQLKIDIDPIYDPLALSAEQKKGTETSSKTTYNDDSDKIFIIDAVEIAPGTKKTIKQVLLQRPSEADENRLEILNGNLSESGYFNWTLLGGFEVGNTVTILTGLNSGVYTVYAVTPTILTLQRATPVGQTETLITIEYTLTNVLYTNRTNEGFTLIENILNPDKFGNLNYSLPKIVYDFYGQEIATALTYRPEGVITVTDPPINELARIQYQGGRIFESNGVIAVSELPAPILSPHIVKTKTVGAFKDVVSMLEKMNTVYPDGTIGGYVRIVGNSGRVFRVHPSKLDNLWLTEALDIEGYPRAELETLTITTIAPGVVRIEEVGYEVTIVGSSWFSILGDDVTILDNNAIQLISPTYYRDITINGVIYDDVESFAIALSEL